MNIVVKRFMPLKTVDRQTVRLALLLGSSQKEEEPLILFVSLRHHCSGVVRLKA